MVEYRHPELELTASATKINRTGEQPQSEGSPQRRGELEMDER